MRKRLHAGTVMAGTRRALTLSVLVAAAVAVTPPAAALTTCTFAGTTATVTIADPATAATIVRSGDEIRVNGVQCDTAVVSNTDLITVTDTTADNLNLTLDLSGGPLAPGATDEAGASDEIEISYSLGASNSDTVTIVGSTGVDDIVIGADGVNLNANEADGIDADVTLAGVDALILQTGLGADEISGAGGSGTGASTSMSVLATPGEGDDTYTGGDGSDRYFASSAPDGADTFLGNAGADSVNYLSRTAALNLTLAGGPDDGQTGEGDDMRAEEVTSGAGADTIVGDESDNQLFGHTGNDDISGMGGSDTFVQGLVGDGDDDISGGDGTDHVMYVNRNAAQPVTVTLDDVADDGGAGEADDIGSDVENVTGGQGADQLFGDADANVLTGSGGADQLVGDDGDDTLDGDAGLDTFDGGSGDDLFLLQETTPNAETVTGGADVDTADYEQTVGNMTITLDGAANDGVAGENDNLLVENVTGGSGLDSITGDGGPNVLHGGSNTDTLNGGGGDDVLAGDDGSDTENGDADDDTFDQGLDSNGADTLNGGTGIDTADYGDRTSAVVVTLDGAANDGTTESDNVGGVANEVENVIGGSSGDTLTGNAAANRLDGSAGTDTLSGLDGNDTLDGGADGDVFIGGNDQDTVTYAGRTTPVVASIGDGSNDGEDVDTDGDADEGDDVQGTVEHLVGGDDNDRLTGNGSSNTLDGGDGDDRLAGGAGIDTENGGSGADTFVQDAASNGGDTLNGGADIDLVDYSLRTVRVVAGPEGAADGEDADADGIAEEADQIAASVENITGGFAKDRLVGNGLANVFLGGAGGDVLIGSAGLDVLRGQQGNDRANGGPGKDKCSAEKESSC